MPTTDLSWLPDIGSAYLTLDLETTHFSPTYGRIVCVGLGHISGPPSLDHCLDLLIRTPYDPVVWGAVHRRSDFGHALRAAGLQLTPALVQAIDAAAGSCRIPQVPAAVAEQFKTAYDAHHISPERSLAEGLDREQALRAVWQMLKDASDAGYWIVGHNILRFDLKYLGVELSAFELSLPSLRVLDTAAVVKAAQMGLTPSESFEAFQRRVLSLPSRTKYALDQHCVPTYRLDRFGVDPAKQHHSPAYDCWVVACLLSALSNPGDPHVPTPTAAHAA